MKSWFPTSAKQAAMQKKLEKVKAEVLSDISRMQKQSREHISILDHVDKLAAHNSTHGKNVVFWSCKRCN